VSDGASAGTGRKTPSDDQVVSCRLYGHMPFPIEDFQPLKKSPLGSGRPTEGQGSALAQRRLFDEL